ncbi:Hypothetical predicted protein [Mytilus galloprovincialis]|nr:Hypothetical predicted protein [Mytilus galloprovincialis]
MSVLLLSFVICSCAYGMETIVKTKHFDIPSQETPLPPSEKFLDIFPLTTDNFTESVMKNKDPWVVIFHEGSIPRAWKTMAASLRGSAWFGMVDINSEEKLVKKIKYENSTDNLARVYPYGLPAKKKNSWKYVKNAEQARLAVIECIPDTSLKIKGRDVQDFLFESFATNPSRFPAVFFTNEEESPSFIRAIYVRFQKYFNFARFVLPTVEDMRAIGLQEEIIDMPSLYILVTPDAGPTEKINFNAIEYRPQIMGTMNYPNILQFLFMVNHQFRHQLQGDNKSNNLTIMNMQDVVEIEQKRFEIMVKGKKQPGRKQPEAPKKEEKVKVPDIEKTATQHTSIKDEL